VQRIVLLPHLSPFSWQLPSSGFSELPCGKLLKSFCKRVILKVEILYSPASALGRCGHYRLGVTIMNIPPLFPMIHVSGSPHDIGYQHGKLAQPQVQASVENYQRMFLDYSSITWETAKDYALSFIPAIEAYDPDIMEEIRGIAEGSGFSLAEILCLNVRSEIVLQGAQVALHLDGGCTSCAFTPWITAHQETLLAQNWDWKLAEKAGCILLHIQQAHKPDILMITEAGIVGKIGFNSAGVGVGLNALASDKRIDAQTVPLHIALRGVLNSRTLSDAIQAAGKMPLACCANFIMASAAGQAVSIEIGPGDIDVLYPESGWIAHTNHFYGPRMAALRDTGRITTPDTYLRLGRIQDLIRHRASDAITAKDIQEMLRDHMGYPDSICRHEDLTEPEEKRMSTVFSVIMDLDRREMLFAPGNPCSCTYQLIRLS
jgi:isopenicillin-N N-acyltransferase-like protein